MIIIIIIMFFTSKLKNKCLFLQWRCSPNLGHGLLILDIYRSHTTHHSW